MPDRPRRLWLIAGTGALALAFLVAGGVVAARADAGLVRTPAVVDGVPLTALRAAGVDGEQPGVVVAHGFAASSTIMNSIANTLARNGFVVVLLDFTGHGASQRRLDLGRLSDSGGQLAADLDVAVRHLRAQPRVDADRVVLVGHSMGAGAVVRYAANHPDIAATVAISLGDATAVPNGADRPRNLLLLVGEYEFPRFRSAAERALAARDPSASDYRFGVTYGDYLDMSSGTARRAQVVPGVEHISILFAERTRSLTMGWLGGAVEPDSGVSLLFAPERLRAGGLLLIGLLLGFFPLAALLLRGRSPASATIDGRALGAGLAGGALLGVLAGALTPDALLGLAVGGWASAVFLAVGGGTLLGWWLFRGRPRPDLSRPRPREVGIGAVLGLYGAATIALPSHIALTYAIPVPQRWWLLALCAVGAGIVCYAAEVVSGRRAVPHVVVLALAAALVTLLAVTGIGPGFTLLVVPILVVILVIQAWYAAVLRRLGAAAWVSAVVGAALLGWPVATSMPLVS